jgi:hypothetical protein
MFPQICDKTRVELHNTAYASWALVQNTDSVGLRLELVIYKMLPAYTVELLPLKAYIL